MTVPYRRNLPTLPFRRQELARFIPFHNYTAKTFAEAVSSLLPGDESISTIDVQNMLYGRKYPSANVCRAIEVLFGGSLPISVYFEEVMLKNYDPALRLAVEA